MLWSYVPSGTFGHDLYPTAGLCQPTSRPRKIFSRRRNVVRMPSGATVAVEQIDAPARSRRVMAHEGRRATGGDRMRKPMQTHWGSSRIVWLRSGESWSTGYRSRSRTKTRRPLAMPVKRIPPNPTLA